jgi:3-deoxy-D-glycero-D-galacto-nononate 9-phosphate synthase
MKNSIYIIGEIGQNHNGSVEIAKNLIDKVIDSPYDETFNTKLPRIDAVKFTKRDLNEELTNSAMAKPYDSPHSFGKTYGEHRAFLELNDSEHFILYQYVKSKGLDYVITLTSLGCSSIFNMFTPDKLKVASRDLTNLPLLEMLAKTRIPIILSTGMSGKDELDVALDLIRNYHEDISILHCVSQYPTEYKNVNLNTIDFLTKNYPSYKIGYSDHTIGIATPVAAVAKGAQIIEKHITLDRTMKGTDQAGSLGPSGVIRMVRDIRNLELSFGQESIFMSPDVASARVKLSRSIASKRRIKKGEVIKECDIHLLSPGDGVRWVDRAEIINKKTKNHIEINELIYKKNVE